MGRKPTPTTLFDEGERTNDAYKKQAESIYKFLNRCARPEWEEVRRETERWYAEFPDPNGDLLRRFRKKDVHQHLPAWWELYVYTLFARLEYDVKVHPQLPGRDEKPDFLVTRGTESFYVEATTAFNDDSIVNPHGQAWVCDFIDSAHNPDFMVDIEFPKVGLGWPGRQEIVARLEAWLAGLDWADARAEWDANCRGYMNSPRWRCRQEHRDWVIEYLATPVQPEARGMVGRRIAIYPTSRGSFIGDVQKIRAKLDDKGGNKYSSLDRPLDKPLVVALQLWHHVDQVDLGNALFGSEQFVWLLDRVGGRVVPGSMRTERIPDGYWRPETDPRGTRISAVLFGNTLSASSVAAKLPVLWVNPWASTPLSGLEPLQTVYVGADNKLAAREATSTAAAVFKLPPAWPNCCG